MQNDLKFELEQIQNFIDKNFEKLKMKKSNALIILYKI